MAQARDRAGRLVVDDARARLPVDAVIAVVGGAVGEDLPGIDDDRALAGADRVLAERLDDTSAGIDDLDRRTARDRVEVDRLAAIGRPDRARVADRHVCAARVAGDADRVVRTLDQRTGLVADVEIERAVRRQVDRAAIGVAIAQRAEVGDAVTQEADTRRACHGRGEVARQRRAGADIIAERRLLAGQRQRAPGDVQSAGKGLRTDRQVAGAGLRHRAVAGDRAGIGRIGRLVDRQQPAGGDAALRQRRGVAEDRRAAADLDAVGIGLRTRQRPIAGDRSQRFEIDRAGKAATRIEAGEAEADGIGASAAIDDAGDDRSALDVQDIVAATHVDGARGTADNRAGIGDGVGEPADQRDRAARAALDRAGVGDRRRTDCAATRIGVVAGQNAGTRAEDRRASVVEDRATADRDALCGISATAGIDAVRAETLNRAVVDHRSEQVDIDAVAIAVDRDAVPPAGDRPDVDDGAHAIGADPRAVAAEDRPGVVDRHCIVRGDAVAQAGDRAARLVVDDARPRLEIDPVIAVVGGAVGQDQSGIGHDRAVTGADCVLAERPEFGAGIVVDDDRRAERDRIEIERLATIGAADDTVIVDPDRARRRCDVDPEGVILRFDQAARGIGQRDRARVARARCVDRATACGRRTDRSCIGDPQTGRTGRPADCGGRAGRQRSAGLDCKRIRPADRLGGSVGGALADDDRLLGKRRGGHEACDERGVSEYVQARAIRFRKHVSIPPGRPLLGQTRC